MIRIRKYLMIFLFGCFAISVFSQVQSSHFFHTIKQTDGLSNGWNAYVHKDSHGFLWINSVDGLNRFDGLNIKVYKSNDEKQNQLKGNNIQSDFFEDSEQNIWFSTYDYINCYRRKTDDFVAYQALDLNGKVIKSGYRIFQLDKNNKLWVQVGSLLYVFDIVNKTFQGKNIFLQHRYAQLCKQTERENILLSYNKALGFDIINIYSNNKFVKESYFHKGKWACNVNDIFVLNDTVYLLGTDLGLLHFNRNKPYDLPRIDSVFQSFSIKNIVSFSKIPNSNELLVTTANEGIFCYDLKQTTYTYQITATNETSDKQMFKKLWRSYVDSSANLWLTTIGEGIRYSAIHKSKFSAISITSNELQLSANSCNFIEDNNKQVLAIAQTGIVCYKNQKFCKNLQLLENRKTIRINHIIKDKSGSIWIAANTGLYQLNESQNKFQKRGINVLLSYLHQLEDGRLLCSGKGGVFVVSPSIQTKIQYFQGIVDTTKSYSNIYQDSDGTIFITQNYESILVYRKKKFDFIAQKELPITGTISGFYEDNDGTTLWIATSNGLVKLNKKTLEYQVITEQHGLPNQYICGLCGDSQNNIWLSTNKGLVRYSPATNIFRHYMIADGLLSEEGIDMALMNASNGIFWLGNAKGINTFRPEEVKNLDSKPQIQLIGFKINDTSSTQYNNITELTELNLPYNQHTVSFNFVAIEYGDPQNNLLQYRLKNYDDKWLTVKNTEGSVRYANLPSGTYYLQVKAANSDGVWNDTIRELKITILTPWHQTWWFYLLCFLTVGAIVGYIVYLRLSKIIDLQEIRIKLYENLHDDLGSRLTAIVMMIDPLIQDIKRQKTPESITNEESQTRTLIDIKNIGRSIVGNMHRLVWATDPSNDELSNVVVQMRKDREILLPKVQLIINIDDGMTKLKMDGNIRYQMLSIFNEALTNISKYAEATIVMVEFICEDDMFSMSINDNGKGFDADTPNENNPLSGGNGFRNMRNRAKRIDGKLTVSSKTGFGTKIVLAFSMIKASFWKRLKESFSKFLPK